MSDYRATPEQWAEAANHASKNYGAAWQCLLELRARVEALEANTKQWRTDHLRLANTCASMAPDRLQFFSDLLPEEGNAKPTPNDRQIRSSLVERVAQAVKKNGAPYAHEGDARAAIREVARWMDENQSPVTAQWLEEEAER